MAFRPSLRSIWTLIAMAVICYGLYLWAEYSRVDVQRDNYEAKIIAANRMNEALRALADRQIAGGDAIESYGDSRVDALIGQQFSTITSDLASFEEKLHGANPNIAAAAVDLFLSAGLKKGDFVAVAFSGSNPGLNIAVLSACDAIGIMPFTVSALSSTWWGATDPRNTWADMQKFLIEKGLFKCNVLAFSRGGLDDNALGMSSVGRAELALAADRNQGRLVESDNLSQAVSDWWSTFESAAAGKSFSAYINVGDAIASLGHKENGALLGNGLHHRLPTRNWPGRGVIHVAAEKGLPVINFYNAAGLAQEFGLGSPKLPLAEPGKGDVFITTRYDLRVAVSALVISLTALFVLVWFDTKYFRLADAGVDPETLL